MTETEPQAKLVRIDYEVFKYLEEKANGFDTVNHVLRRLFGLPPSNVKRGPKEKKNKNGRKAG